MPRTAGGGGAAISSKFSAWWTEAANVDRTHLEPREQKTRGKEKFPNALEREAEQEELAAHGASRVVAQDTSSRASRRPGPDGQSRPVGRGAGPGGRSSSAATGGASFQSVGCPGGSSGRAATFR